MPIDQFSLVSSLDCPVDEVNWSKDVPVENIVRDLATVGIIPYLVFNGLFIFPRRA